LQEKHRTGYGDLKGAWIKMMTWNGTIILDSEYLAWHSRRAIKRRSLMFASPGSSSEHQHRFAAV
jgi:hypothetical protein